MGPHKQPLKEIHIAPTYIPIYSILFSCICVMKAEPIPDTWTSVTYSISARMIHTLSFSLGASIFLDYVSINIDNASGLPYICKVYKKYCVFFYFDVVIGKS